MIWSIGVILHLMLFKRLPYEAKTKPDLLLKMHTSKLIIKNDIKPLFKTILMGCL
jgi:serine/threonine protein kinase